MLPITYGVPVGVWPLPACELAADDDEEPDELPELLHATPSSVIATAPTAAANLRLCAALQRCVNIYVSLDRFRVY
jgi:hypothetical protein